MKNLHFCTPKVLAHIKALPPEKLFKTFRTGFVPSFYPFEYIRVNERLEGRPDQFLFYAYVYDVRAVEIKYLRPDLLGPGEYELAVEEIQRYKRQFHLSHWFFEITLRKEGETNPLEKLSPDRKPSHPFWKPVFEPQKKLESFITKSDQSHCHCGPGETQSRKNDPPSPPSCEPPLVRSAGCGGRDQDPSGSRTPPKSPPETPETGPDLARGVMKYLREECLPVAGSFFRWDPDAGDHAILLEDLEHYLGDLASREVGEAPTTAGLWYLAHPYYGDAGTRARNFADACRLSTFLLARGIAHVNPIAMTHPIHAYWSQFHEFSKDAEYQLYLLFLDRRICEYCAGLILCEGWEASRGCQVEKQWFEAWGKPIKYLSRHGNFYSKPSNFHDLEARNR